MGDLVIYDKDLMKVSESEILNMKPVHTPTKGQKSSNSI
jgi:predicted amidohydrolase YtcJ